MSCAMKRYLFLYSCTEHPPLYGFVRAAWRMYVAKWVVVLLAPLSEKLRRLWRNVKVFKTARLFLLEYNPCKVALFVYVAPSQP